MRQNHLVVKSSDINVHLGGQGGPPLYKLFECFLRQGLQLAIRGVFTRVPAICQSPVLSLNKMSLTSGARALT